MNELITRQLKDGVYTIVLNRPDKLNCINLEMLELLDTSTMEAQNNADIRIVVIRGAGERAFSTGGDLKVFNSLSEKETVAWIRKGQTIFDRLDFLPKPTIALIQGYAFGGGLELAMACDFRLATRCASFRLPEVLHGWPPGWGGLGRLKRLVGEARAKEMILLAQAIDAETAKIYGLLTVVVEQTELDNKLQSMIETLLAISPDVYMLAKEALQGLATSKTTGAAFDSLAALYAKFIQHGNSSEKA